jgi:predicted nucleic acid-binding Zn ribbon protein
MGGGGAMAGMNLSLKNNRNLLKESRRAFNGIEDEGFIPGYHKPLQFKKIPQAKLEEIRQRIREERKRERMKMAIVLSILGLALVGMFFLIASYFA